MDTKEIDGFELHESLAKLPIDHQLYLKSLIAKYNSREVIRKIRIWIDEYDENSALDIFMTTMIERVIDELGSAIVQDKEGRSDYSGIDATRIAVKKFKEIADSLEKVVGLIQ